MEPSPRSGDAAHRTLLLACGALAREIAALRAANDWTGLDVHYLEPELHNRPERIPAAVAAYVREHGVRYARIFIGYADCGTGGALDAVLEALRAETGAVIERVPGVHCYEFYAGRALFATLADAEPGTFYLTDFLVRHFDRLVIRGLGLDRHPELTTAYFGNYRRLVYLAQNPSDADRARAQAIAAQMGWAYEYHHTGYGLLGEGLAGLLSRHPQEPRPWPA